MCGACYTGITDVVGTSAPFIAGGVAVARHRVSTWLPFGRRAPEHGDEPRADRSPDERVDLPR